jgi:A/G-specific adenine glycosylase
MVIEATNKAGSEFLLMKRGEKDIWKNLYEFPSVEFENEKEPEKVIDQFNLIYQTNLKQFHIKNISENYIHQLTHQQINAVFIRLIVNNIEKIEAENSILLSSQKKITDYPVSRLTERYMQDQEII